MTTSRLRPWQWALIIVLVLIALIVIGGYIPISSGGSVGSVTNG